MGEIIAALYHLKVGNLKVGNLNLDQVESIGGRVDQAAMCKPRYVSPALCAADRLLLSTTFRVLLRVLPW